MGRNKTEEKGTLCCFISSSFCCCAKHKYLHWLFGSSLFESSSFIEQEWYIRHRRMCFAGFELLVIHLYRIMKHAQICWLILGKTQFPSFRKIKKFGKLWEICKRLSNLVVFECCNFDCYCYHHTSHWHF